MVKYGFETWAPSKVEEMFIKYFPKDKYFIHLFDWPYIKQEAIQKKKRFNLR